MLKQREPPVEEPFYKKFKRKLEQDKLAEEKIKERLAKKQADIVANLGI